MSRSDDAGGLRIQYDAVVLAGGRSRRMGGGDKTALLVGGAPLLERALDAACDAAQIVVVGVARETTRAVRWTQEQPPGGGPAAAVAAGLRLVGASVVVVLAADLPFVTAATVRRLVARAEPFGAVMVDAEGVPQWLLGGWPSDLLRGALEGDQAGRSLRETLAPLGPALLTGDGGGPEWFDCDEPQDLAAAKELMDGRAGRLAR
jgi:molybdopterin-guanine dinucleotide biosynthesis protein A